jgi:hypothetical protein
MSVRGKNQFYGKNFPIPKHCPKLMEEVVQSRLPIDKVLVQRNRVPRCVFGYWYEISFRCGFAD